MIRLNCRVEHIDDNRVSLATGEMLQARAIVIATEAGSLSAKSTSETRPVFHRASCLYFSADQAPIDEPILLLNGDGKGPINHLAVMSCVSPEYAPAGKHLISVNVVDQDAALDADLIDKVQTQLLDWFGDAARTWQLLRHDRIERAIPQQHVIPQASVRFKPGLYQCGDHLGIASINTAMMTGREAAEAIIEDFKNC